MPTVTYLRLDGSTPAYKGENSFIWDFSVPVIGHGRVTKGRDDGVVSKQYYKTTYDI